MQYLLKGNLNLSPVRIILPASKSISNRLLMMSALSSGRLKAIHLSESDDTWIMQKLLQCTSEEKDAGHAGTAMRFMTAYFAVTPGKVFLTGTSRMKERPIAELVEKLRELGAEIEYTEKEGFPPLRIRGKKLSGGRLHVNSTISSQYISALMMIGPGLKGGLELVLEGQTISSSYIRITAALMKQAGIEADYRGNIVSIPEGEYRDTTIAAEPDWSAASYWFPLAGLSGKAEITLDSLAPGSLQGDSVLPEFFKNLGVKAVFQKDGLILSPEPVHLKRFECDFTENPDLVQTFVPYCVARQIPFRFSGCQSLLIKETNRVEALKKELLKFKINLNHAADGSVLWWDAAEKPVYDQPVSIETYHDHRMAMAFAPLCQAAGSIRINDPMVVSKSYPGFWEDLKKAGLTISET